MPLIHKPFFSVGRTSRHTTFYYYTSEDIVSRYSILYALFVRDVVVLLRTLDRIAELHSLQQVQSATSGCKARPASQMSAVFTTRVCAHLLSRITLCQLP